METKTPIDFRFAAALACLVLIYPLAALASQLLSDSPSGTGMGRVGGWLWLLIAALWLAITHWSGSRRPVATLAVVGFFAGLLLLLAISLIEWGTGTTGGLLFNPYAVVAVLMLHALGGLACGLVLWFLQSLARGRRS